MIKNPCYDTKTKTSCSKRCAGCATTCKDWKLYEADRNSRYGNNSDNVEVYEWDRAIRLKRMKNNGGIRKRR